VTKSRHFSRQTQELRQNCRGEAKDAVKAGNEARRDETEAEEASPRLGDEAGIK